MHLKRQEATTKLPIRRKGTTYIVRPSSNLNNSVPVVVALRDMLKLAKTTSEVKKMIIQKLLKINGKHVESYRQSIQLFNLLEADKPYILSLLPTGKFIFQPTSSSDMRLTKVINKKLNKSNMIQLNLHDGTNILTKNKISIGDTLYLDLSNKIKKHVPLEKDKAVFITSGKYIGMRGKILKVDGKKVLIQLENNDKTTELNERQLIVQ